MIYLPDDWGWDYGEERKYMTLSLGTLLASLNLLALTDNRSSVVASLLNIFCEKDGPPASYINFTRERGRRRLSVFLDELDVLLLCADCVMVREGSKSQIHPTSPLERLGYARSGWRHCCAPAAPPRISLRENFTNEQHENLFLRPYHRLASDEADQQLLYFHQSSQIKQEMSLISRQLPRKPGSRWDQE